MSCPDAGLQAPEEMELSPCFYMPRHPHLKQPQHRFDPEPAKQRKNSIEMPCPVGRLPADTSENAHWSEPKMGRKFSVSPGLPYE